MDLSPDLQVSAVSFESLSSFSESPPVSLFKVRTLFTP